MSYITRRKRPVAPSALSQGVGLGTALLTGLMASTAGAADAQQSNQADTSNLAPISVKASTTSDYKSDSLSSSKFTQPVSETPQTIQIINKDLIKDQNATTLTEALQNSAGVGTFYAGENGNSTTGDSVYMRGFDSSSSIFVDGVRDLGSVSRDTFNLEQVEVIKGPAGTDYGRTAPSGSINLSTKQAFMANRHSGSVIGGTDGEKRATLDINRKLTDNVAGRLNVMGQDSDVAGRDKVNDSRWGVAPALTIELDPQSRLYLNYLHVTQDNVPDGGVSTVGLPGYTSPDPARPEIGQAPKVDSENFYGSRADHNDVEVNMATAIFEYDMSDRTQLRNTLRWGRTEQDYMLTAIMADDGRFNTPDINDRSSWEIYRLPNLKNQTNTIMTNQLGMVSRVDGGNVFHTLSYGVELAREKIESTGMASPTVPDANLYNPNYNFSPSVKRDGSMGKGTTDTVSAYLFDTMDISRHWQVNAGVRIDHYSTDYESTHTCTGNRDPDACNGQPNGAVVQDVNASTSDNLLNWKLGGVYKFNPQFNLYADYAVSAQPPGGSSLELSNGGSDNPIFDPEEARTFELGAKWKLAGNRLLLTAAAYRTDVTDLVQYDRSAGSYFQIGEQRVQGVELSAVGNITDNWNLSAGFTTMDTEVREGVTVSQDGGNGLTYTPEKAFTSWTTYRLPFDLTVGGGARYTGGLKRGTDGAVGTPEYTESYWVFDAMASYPLSDNADLRLNVYNLADKDYVAAINKSGYRYDPGTPLSASLALNVTF